MTSLAAIIASRVLPDPYSPTRVVSFPTGNPPSILLEIIISNFLSPVDTHYLTSVGDPSDN